MNTSSIYPWASSSLILSCLALVWDLLLSACSSTSISERKSIKIEGGGEYKREHVLFIIFFVVVGMGSI